MPGTRCEFGPAGKPVMKYSIHIDGDWSKLTELQKLAYNQATRALNDLAIAMGLDEPVED